MLTPDYPIRKFILVPCALVCFNIGSCSCPLEIVQRGNTKVNSTYPGGDGELVVDCSYRLTVHTYLGEMTHIQYVVLFRVQMYQ